MGRERGFAESIDMSGEPSDPAEYLHWLEVGIGKFALPGCDDSVDLVGLNRIGSHSEPVNTGPPRESRFLTSRLLNPWPLCGAYARVVDQQTLLAMGPAAQHAALRERTVSSRELTVASLSAIERENARLNAVVELLSDEAFDAADEADKRLAKGDAAPLLGLPIAIKNDLDVAGHLTGCGSRANERRAEVDGEMVAMLRDRGAVPVATTTLPELAIYGFTESLAQGITRNPHDLDHTPGGSSGGSAALLAAGAVPLATAGDGAGSVRIPAACCGLVGFKPTHRTMPGSGGWFGLATQGALAKRVEDAGFYLDALGTFSTSLQQAAQQTPPRLKIGVSISASAALRAEKLDQPVKDSLAAVADVLDKQGHRVKLVKIAYGVDSKALTIRYLAGIRQQAQQVDNPGELEPRTKRIARLGQPFGSRSIEWARTAGQRWGRQVHADLDVDVLLTPVMSSAPLEVGSFARRSGLGTVLAMNAFFPYTAQWNHAGLPAVSVPWGQDDGLPLAVQLIGRGGQDATLMALAAQLEAQRTG